MQTLRIALGVLPLLCLPALGQIPVGKVPEVAKDDPIYPVLAEYQASLEKRYKKGAITRPEFSAWVKVESPAAAKLFPKLRFASFSWSEHSVPGAESRAAARAIGLGVTLAIDADTKRLVKELFCWGNYEAYGKLLVEHKIPLRDAADAKRVWDAFCDIHQRHWKEYGTKKISATEWHLGIYSYDQTISATEKFKTEVTRTHFSQVLVDPKTGHITEWKSVVRTFNERKTPVK